MSLTYPESYTYCWYSVDPDGNMTHLESSFQLNSTGKPFSEVLPNDYEVNEEEKRYDFIDFEIEAKKFLFR